VPRFLPTDSVTGPIPLSYFSFTAAYLILYVRHTPEQQVCILNTTYKRQISEDRIEFELFPGPVAQWSEPSTTFSWQLSGIGVLPKLLAPPACLLTCPTLGVWQVLRPRSQIGPGQVFRRMRQSGNLSPYRCPRGVHLQGLVRVSCQVGVGIIAYLHIGTTLCTVGGGCNICRGTGRQQRAGSALCSLRYLVCILSGEYSCVPVFPASAKSTKYQFVPRRVPTVLVDLQLQYQYWYSTGYSR